MKRMKAKMVCAICGGENVNDERIVSIRINDSTIKSDQHIDYYCDDCRDNTQIVSKEYFHF